MVATYFAPIHQVDSWHISRSISALLTLALFYYADTVRVRINRERNTELTPDIIIQTIEKFRLLFGLWTIFCGLFLLYSEINWDAIPAIRWFPT